MTDITEACSGPLCRQYGDPPPARPDTRTVAEVLAAADPHARPARRPRGAKAHAAPGLFDAPADGPGDL